MTEAAERLGITKEAVRKRISRGTLRSEKDPDGRVQVYIPSSGTAAATFDRDELIAELRAHIEHLRTDRDAWRDLARRSDYLASAAFDLARELEARLRELETPQESPSDAPESPETAPTGGDAGPPPVVPMPLSSRRAYVGRGGGECSAGEPDATSPRSSSCCCLCWRPSW